MGGSTKSTLSVCVVLRFKSSTNNMLYFNGYFLCSKYSTLNCYLFSIVYFLRDLYLKQENDVVDKTKLLILNLQN